MGLTSYTIFVVIPSVAGNLLDRANILPCYYYDQPWKYQADLYGGVDRGRYSSQAGSVSEHYFNFAALFN